MAFGLRAAPLVFSVTIGVVFSLARPPGGALVVSVASACGTMVYALWAFVSAKCLENRYRALAVASAVEAAGALLAARARVLRSAHSETESDTERARFEQLNDEVGLAQALQAARDLVHPALPAPAASLQAATLARVAEVRELVLTSRLDLALLGKDAAARFVLARLAARLRQLGAALTELGGMARGRHGSALPPYDGETALPDMAEAQRLLSGDPRERVLPIVALRLRYLSEEVEAIRGLVRGDTERHSLGPEELRPSAEDESWPLGAVVEHLTLRSPVLRHALRSTLALSAVYYLAHALPWATKPYWMLLSVAVVLRGTLDDTLSRRNARVLGTAIGCVLVAVTVPLVPEPLLQVSFVVAVGAAHAFVNVRYLLTAVAATFMALLQAHFVSPYLGFLVVERLLDTVLGALFAWAFSYVLPSWERRALPAAVEQLVAALRLYGDCALSPTAARSEQRLSRQRAYDALAVVAAAVRRSAAEPKRVRPPVPELVNMLDHAQRLMAHLSSVRSLLARRRARLPPEATSEALRRARQILSESLTPDAALVATKSAGLSIAGLPLTSVELEPLPWLQRRLEASEYDARLAGAAAREALRQLAPVPASPRPLSPP